MSDEALSVRVNVSAISAGTAPLELSLLRTDLAADVYGAFTFAKDVQHVTSFQLEIEGQKVDDQTPLSELVVSEKQTTLNLDAKPKAYTVKSITEHLIAVRALASVHEGELFSINSGISKFDELELEDISKSQPEEVPAAAAASESSGDDEKASEKKNPPKPTDEEQAAVASILESYFKDLPSNFTTPSQLTTPAVRGLSLSAWNPVPLNYRAKGHLVYIEVQTIESEILQITGTTSGFYVNKSSRVKFDPSPKEPVSHSCFTLYGLLSETSKGFLPQIKQNTEKLSKLDPVTFLKPQTTFLSYPWITKPGAVTADFGREQFAESFASRDFNDEIQSLREFPGKTFQEKIVCERLLAKSAFEFTTQAVKGALDIFSGAIAPMQPTDDPAAQIYLHNGIFYSYAVDSGSYADKGGDDAARAASNQDLNSLNYLNRIESKGIYTLMTAIVDYAGKRIVCQTPVPGLFASSEPIEIKNEETGELEQADGEPLTQINYGRDENEGSIKTNKDFVEALETYREVLHFKKEQIGEEKIELVTSPDIKGMVGTDNRKYLIDLYNATPLDIEFVEEHFKPNSDESYPHRQAVIRLEAVQKWWSHKTNELLTAEAKAKGIDLSAPVKEGEKLPEIDVDQSKLLFSVDAFQSGGKEDANVRDLSKFIKAQLIPKFIEQFDESLNIVPIDGTHLTSLLHKAGINVRYLGEIAKILETKIENAKALELEAFAHHEAVTKKFNERVEAHRTAEEKKLIEAQEKGEKYTPTAAPENVNRTDEDEAEVKEELATLITPSKLYEQLLAIINQELITRASKHVLRSFSATLPVELIPSLISHFHNALLGSQFNESPVAEVHNTGFYSEKDLEFTKLTPASVRELIEKTVQIRYRTTLPENWSQSIRSVQLQREIARKFGIQWIQRDYYFTTSDFERAQALAAKEKKGKRQPSPSLVRENVFSPNDVSLAPIIKSSIPRATTGEQYFETGRLQAASSEAEKKNEGVALITEAITIFEQTYGQVHPEVQRVYTSLAQVYRDLEMKTEATLMARRAVAIAERVFGLDSHETIIAYLNLGYFETESGNIHNALKVYARATQILTTVFTNNHISIPNIFGDVVTLLQDKGYIKSAIQLLNKLIELCEQLQSGDSYALGFLKFRLAYLQTYSGDLAQSLKNSEHSHKILEKFASANHYLTKQVGTLKHQMAHYLEFEAKVKKQQALEKSKQEAQKNQQPKETKGSKKNTNSDVSHKSVEDILQFVMGQNPSTKGKKSKKSKK